MTPSAPRGSIRAFLPLVGALLVIGGVGVWLLVAPPANAPAAPEGATGYEFVGRTRCPDSDFSCITLRVPRDHFAPSGGPTIDVTFALLRASSGTSQGVFVTATGGPGTSGLAVADSYTSALDPRIAEELDIVFFDQRGIGLSEPIQCPEAVLEFYTTPDVPTVSDAEAQAYAQAARTFSADCVEEMGVEPEDLAAYATRQTVEDLEAFRSWLGAERLHLYGESYGSQYVQVYASAHPDRVATLLLDGPVDLTLTGRDYYVEQARAFDAALVHTLDACAADEACVGDVEGGGPLAAWDALAAQLQTGPIGYDFVTALGEVERRQLGFGDLEAAAAGHVYSNFDQMLLQRALAQATRGELMPMARLLYVALAQDPESLDPIPDPTFSDALYYAVECMDYAFGSGSTAEREAAYLSHGASAGVSDVRLGSIYYGDLPCVSWPVRPDSDDRPSYLSDAAYQVVVLASTTDPATPYAGAVRLFENAADGYLITQPGGPHVIFGRGNPCPDDQITELLLTGTPPAERETTCDEIAPDAYVPLPAAVLTDDLAPLDAMVATDDEVNNSPDFWNWDEVEPLSVGCLHGGALHYTATDVGYEVTLTDCALTDGLPLSGEAVIDDEAGTFSLDVISSGDTDLAYTRDADGEVSVSGRWRGAAVK